MAYMYAVRVAMALVRTRVARAGRPDTRVIKHMYAHQAPVWRPVDVATSNSCVSSTRIPNASTELKLVYDINFMSL